MFLLKMVKNLRIPYKGQLANSSIMKKIMVITIAAIAFMLVMAAYVFVTPLAAFGAVNLNSSKSNIYKVGNDTYIAIGVSLPYAPMALSGDNNVYVVWWTNKSGNWEVMFRSSNDGGATFGDKINLSNSPEADSTNAEIIAAGNNVYVSWWETSLTTGSSESVLRVSTDAGQTFGPAVMLGTNGTITTTATTTATNTATAAEGEATGELPPPSPDTDATGGGSAANETAGNATTAGEPIPDIGSEEGVGGGAEPDPSIAINEKGVK
jgi:hypothetical protein